MSQVSGASVDRGVFVDRFANGRVLSMLLPDKEAGIS
jgi:hypothetical protein